MRREKDMRDEREIDEREREREESLSRERLLLV